MNTDLNGKIQGKLNQNRKNRNTKKVLLVLSLAAVIFTSTVLANPASALTEDVSGEVVQGMENGGDSGSGAQAPVQAAVEQADAQGNEAAPSSDPQETLAAPSADQGVMNANSVSAANSAAVTENGTGDSGIAVSGAEADRTEKSDDQISAAEGSGTAEQGATLAEAAETVSTEEAAAEKTTEKTEQAAQSETDVLSFADDRAQMKVTRKDGTGFPSDTTMSGSSLGTDDWNRVLSAVSSKVKAQSDDSTAYSVAGLHTWTLSLQAGDGSAASYDDIRAEAEFQGGLNDAGYATKTSEKEENGTDGTSTTTASYKTSWRVYAISGDSIADPVEDQLTDHTDADGTSLSVDENGALQSAAFDGSLPETVVFAQIVRETVTTGTEKKKEIPMPAVTFDKEAATDHGTITVHVEADEGTFEQGTTMSVKQVSSQDILDKAIEAAGGRGSAAAVDISFRKADGTETEPAKPIRVKMTAKVLSQADKVHVVHVDDTGSTDVVAKKSDGKTIESTSDKAASSDAKNTVSFESDSFSVYAIVYTVDFEYSVNGKMYQFSLHGGEKITLSDLVEVLGIIDGTNFEDAEDFLAEVADVEFSDESLVKVTKNKEGDDWTLESLQAFDTEESLTITMKNGDVVTVKVTDDRETTSPWNLANIDNTQWFHVAAETSVTQNEQERDAAFKLTFTYSLTEDVVHAIDDYEGNPVLVYDLNSLINDSPIGSIRNNLNGVISIGSRKLGNYVVQDGVVTLTFTDPSYFDGRSSFTGFFSLTAETSESELGGQDEVNYEFPGTTDVIPIRYKKTVEEGTKSVNSTKNSDGSYTLNYTANINVNSDLDSMMFNDTLGGLQSLDASSVKINGTAVNVSQSGQSFSFNVASALGTTGVAKGSYKVTYDTKVTEAQLKAMSEDKTTETNTASWKVNGNKDVPGGDTTIEIDKPREPIPVTKTVDKTDAQPGDTVTYTITYGKDTTVLSGFHISDYITDVVIPQGDVTLSYNGQTTPVNFDSQATNTSYSKGTVTLFDYTFPEGTTGNGPVTATYTVKLIDADTAKANGIYDTTEVSNTAQEHRQNTTDTEKTTVTYEKEPVYTVVKSESSRKRNDGKWDPDTIINYTLKIGDADTNMAGVNIKDSMTDLQVLQGDVMIKVGNGSQMKLSDYVSGAMKWSDDGQYSANDVELFNFNMPSDAGKGPVVITYTTKVISQKQATSSDVFGENHIRNTGSGGKQSDSTDNTGVFDPYPIDKQVTKENADVNHQAVEMGDTVHYTLTYGEAGMNLSGAVIEDQMTDLQKLVSAITVTKADGTKFTMPTGTGQWSEDGNNWDFWDDGKYSTGKICLFKYKLPADIGQGPITIEYDTQIISEAEANESGIHGDQSAFNDFKDNHDTVETEVKIEFPKQVTHNPQIRKKFLDCDIENSIVYWDIIVEKQDESGYPLENVEVEEKFSDIHLTEPSQGYNNDGTFNGDNFDTIHAVVTTDDGTVLTPGKDYTVDRAKAKFTFPVVNERLHIKLAFLSPAKIVDGYKILNTAELLNPYATANAEWQYNSPDIGTLKNGQYDENNRLVKWEVIVNPTKKEFADSDPVSVLFSDNIPKGLTLVNYTTKETNNPSIYIQYQGGLWLDWEKEVSVDENNVINTDVSAHGYHENPNNAAGLNKNKIIVTYYTLLSDEEWDRITSSASGSETFQNNVTITAGDNKKFDATDKVTVTSDGYITKTDTTKEKGGIVVDETTGQNSKSITYSIEINPHGYALNNGNTLSLTDYIATNMDLDTSSVSISNATLGADGKLHAGDTAPVGIEVSYNDDARLLSLREIPDRTPLLLTYTCIARAQGEDTFTNTATLVGGGSHSDSTSEKHTIQTSEAGVKVDGIDMSIHKIDENNISNNLAQAKFQLYECELKIGDLTNTETHNQAWWDALLAKVDRRTAGNATAAEIAEIDDQFKIVNYKSVGEPVVSGESGYTQWTGLNEHKLYAWKEVEAPEGYTGNEDYHYFVVYQHINVNSADVPQPLLPEPEQLNRKHAAWALDDACQFANGIQVASMANLTTWTATNVESKYTSISATKVWENDSDNLFETRPEGGIKLQLVRINADGTTENIGEKVSINVDNEGNWPTYIWNKLPVKDKDGNALKYTVVEDKVENYSTTYSDGGEGQTSGEITVTNRMIPKSTDIHVKKVFDVDEGDEMPSEIKVSLMVIKTDRDGVVGEPEETSYETRLSDSNDWSWTFESLPTTDADGNTLAYTAVEDTAALAAQGFRYIVSYSDDGAGVIETTADEPLVITNSKEYGSITVNKSVLKNNAADEEAVGQTITVGLFSTEQTNGSEIKPDDTKTITIGDNSTGSVTFDKLTLGRTYYVYEIVGGKVVTDGSTTTINSIEYTAGQKTAYATLDAENKTATINITNSRTVEKEIDFEFTKIWRDGSTNIGWPSDTTITVTLHKKLIDNQSKDLTTPEVIATYKLSSNSVENKSPESAPECTPLVKDGKNMYRISGLQSAGSVIKDGRTISGNWYYYITEDKVSGYQDPKYVALNSDGSIMSGYKLNYVENGQEIINQKDSSYILPSTGGHGTLPLAGAGAFLLLLAGTALTVRKLLIQRNTGKGGRFRIR